VRRQRPAHGRGRAGARVPASAHRRRVPRACSPSHVAAGRAPEAAQAHGGYPGRSTFWAADARVRRASVGSLSSPHLPRTLALPSPSHERVIRAHQASLTTCQAVRRRSFCQPPSLPPSPPTLPPAPPPSRSRGRPRPALTGTPEDPLKTGLFVSAARDRLGHHRGARAHRGPTADLGTLAAGPARADSGWAGISRVKYRQAHRAHRPWDAGLCPPGGGRSAGLAWAVTPARGREKSRGPSNRPLNSAPYRAGTQRKSQIGHPHNAKWQRANKP